MGTQRPAVAKDDGLLASPVVVVDLRAVLRREPAPRAAPHEVCRPAYRNSVLRLCVVLLDGPPHSYERVDEVVDLVTVQHLTSVADLKLGRSAALLVLGERDTERPYGFGHGWNVTTFARVREWPCLSGSLFGGPTRSRPNTTSRGAPVPRECATDCKSSAPLSHIGSGSCVHTATTAPVRGRRSNRSCSERLLNTAGSSAFISFEGCWIIWIAGRTSPRSEGKPHQRPSLFEPINIRGPRRFSYIGGTNPSCIISPAMSG